MRRIRNLWGLASEFLRNRKNLADAFAAFTVRISAAFLAFGVHVFLARTLELGEYGIYVTLWTWLTVVNHIAVLGFSESALRFLPRYTQRNKQDWALGFLKTGYKYVITGSLGISAVALALTGVWENWIPSAYHLPLIVLTIGLPFLCLELYLEGVSRSFGWYLLTTVPGYIIRPLVIAAGVGGVYLSGTKPDAATVLTVAVLITALITITQTLIIRSRLRKQFPGAKASKSKRVWLAASLPLLFIVSVDEIFVWSDILILGVMASAEEVSVYFAAHRAMSLAAFVQYAFMLVSVRDFSLANAMRNKDELQLRITTATRWTFWLTLPAVLITLVAGYPLLAIFGPDFVKGYPVMIVLGIGFIIRASVGQARDLLIVLGHQKASVAIALSGILINIGFSVLLIPIYGILGAALATTGTFLLQVIAQVIITKRLTGLWVLTDIPEFSKLPGQIRMAIATR